MSWALDEFYASVEEEFGVAIDDPEQLDTPGAVIDYVATETPPADGMDDVTSAFGIRFLGTIRKPPTAQRLREILDADTPQLTRMTR